MDNREQQLSHLEKTLKALRLAFDLYFQGLERVPPKQTETNCIAHSFSFKPRTMALPQLFVTVSTRCYKDSRVTINVAPTMVAIENGTSKRDRFRVAQKRSQGATAGRFARTPGCTSGPQPVRATTSKSSTGPSSRRKIKWQDRKPASP